MKAFGRNIKLKSIPRKIKSVASMAAGALAFSNPLKLWKAYVSMSPPEGNLFKLRNGYTFYLSGNPHDSITVMVIFCRNEYGKIPKDGIVIDIGANIGAFSIYAAMKGARKIFAFEPNRESFEILKKNVAMNNLQNVIFPFNFAVTSRDNDVIRIPKAASPYNRINIDMASAQFDEVPTISMVSILQKVGDEKVDLCKMDCEGAEYDILFNTDKNKFKQIRHFRMEHHDDKRKAELIRFFENCQFTKIHDQNIILWFESIQA